MALGTALLAATLALGVQAVQMQSPHAAVKQAALMQDSLPMGMAAFPSDEEIMRGLKAHAKPKDIFAAHDGNDLDATARLQKQRSAELEAQVARGDKKKRLVNLAHQSEAEDEQEYDDHCGKHLQASMKFEETEKAYMRLQDKCDALGVCCPSMEDDAILPKLQAAMDSHKSAEDLLKAYRLKAAKAETVMRELEELETTRDEACGDGKE